MSKVDQLYALLTGKNACIVDFGWRGQEFNVWVAWEHFKEFLTGIERIFGDGIYQDNYFAVCIKQDCIVIDLCAALDRYIDVAKVFPKEAEVKYGKKSNGCRNHRRGVQ